MKFYPPEAVQKNGKRALEYKKLGSTAMTRIGWYRATQLAQGKGVSKDIILRMNAFLRRHKKNARIERPDLPRWKDKGYVAYVGWGGYPGLVWTDSVIQKYNLRR